VQFEQSLVTSVPGNLGSWVEIYKVGVRLSVAETVYPELQLDLVSEIEQSGVVGNLVVGWEKVVEENDGEKILAYVVETWTHLS